MPRTEWPDEQVCPDELVLAAFVDGLLPPAESTRCREHLAGCADCRQLVADVVIDLRRPMKEAVPELPAAVRERVRRLVPDATPGPRLSVVPGGPGSREHSPADEARHAPLPGSSRGRPLFPRWILLAAAAGIVVVAGVRWFGTAPTPPQGGSEIPEMRGDALTGFATLSPGDRALLAVTGPEALELVWRAVPGSVIDETGRGGVESYEVTILDAAGKPIWSATTRDTRLRVSADAPLEAGHTYSWTVAAHLQLGGTLETRTSTFSLSR